MRKHPVMTPMKRKILQSMSSVHQITGWGRTTEGDWRPKKLLKDPQKSSIQIFGLNSKYPGKMATTSSVTMHLFTEIATCMTFLMGIHPQSGSSLIPKLNRDLMRMILEYVHPAYVSYICTVSGTNYRLQEHCHVQHCRVGTSSIWVFWVFCKWQLATYARCDNKIPCDNKVRCGNKVTDHGKKPTPSSPDSASQAVLDLIHSSWA